ncbi:MAG: Rrf2 family transcriptional regulator [Flavobacteriaceae bacterium]|nr:Rrf2 family transcriptional regulator [Bacteroidia bacterium]NNK86969.1 Rrf2 family transcriptional regulator [Flavobacteriaceae bacterium]
MLTNACQYAIRSILYLAIYASKENKKGVKTISEALDTPQPFLAKLLQRLVKGQLITSVKGPNGGFYLTEDNLRNSIWDVVNCIDSKHNFEACFLGLAECEDDNPCPVHHIVSPFKQEILNDFRDKSIYKLAEEIKSSDKIISLKEFNC